LLAFLDGQSDSCPCVREASGHFGQRTPFKRAKLLLHHDESWMQQTQVKLPLDESQKEEAVFLK
jgi:hypothetical protein